MKHYCPSAEVGVDLITYALCALALYPEARAFATRAGPESFPPGPSRDIARALVLEQEYRPARKSTAYLAEASAIIRCMQRNVDPATGLLLPDTPEWAAHILTVLSELRYRHLVGDQLAWCAEQVRMAAAPLRFIRAQAAKAFDIAEGLTPLDPAESWRGEAA